MQIPMDRFKDPVTPQPVMKPGAIDEATVPDPALEAEAEAPILDPATGTVYYEPRP